MRGVANNCKVLHGTVGCVKNGTVLWGKARVSYSYSPWYNEVWFSHVVYCLVGFSKVRNHNHTVMLNGLRLSGDWFGSLRQGNNNHIRGFVKYC